MTLAGCDPTWTVFLVKKIVLVLLPGLEGTGRLFADFVAALGPEFDPVVVRYPADIPLGYSDLESRVREALPGGGQFLLLGESFSGPLAISVAASRPAGLAGLILCCSFARYPRRSFRLLRPLARFMPVKGRVVSFFRNLASRGAISSALRSKIAAVDATVSSRVLRKRIDELLRVDFRTKLRDVTVPMLYLQASWDGIVPHQACTEIRAIVPAIRVIQFETSHFLLQSVPAEAAAAVREFAKLVCNGEFSDQ